MIKLTTIFLTLSALIFETRSISTAEKFVALHQPNDSIELVKKSIRFINDIKRDDLKKESFVLIDNPFNFDDYNCLKNAIADTLFFTKEEIATFRSWQFINQRKWSSKDFRNVKIIDADTINAIISSPVKSYEYSKKKSIKGWYQFSIPYFFRNNTYCLFYENYYCGFDCGEGKLVLYKKEGNLWISFRTYCQWIS